MDGSDWEGVNFLTVGFTPVHRVTDVRVLAARGSALYARAGAINFVEDSLPTSSAEL